MTSCSLEALSGEAARRYETNIYTGQKTGRLDPRKYSNQYLWSGAPALGSNAIKVTYSQCGLM